MGTQVKIFIQKVRNTSTAALYEAIDNSSGQSMFIEAVSLKEVKEILDQKLQQFGLVRKHI
jgi:hypothetical protein